MKIALLLYGQPRTFDWSWEVYKEFLIDKYDCDVFMHLWTNADRRGHHGSVSDEEIEKYRAHFKPEKYTVRDQIESFEGRDWRDQDLSEWQTAFPTINKYWTFKICSQFYSLMACNNLRKDHEAETGVKYDCIIKVRTDVRPKVHFNYAQAITHQDVIWFSGMRSYGGMVDHYAWGSDAAMNAYCNFYNGMFELLPKQKSRQAGIETLQRDWMQQNGFKVQVFHGQASLYPRNEGDEGG